MLMGATETNLLNWQKGKEREKSVPKRGRNSAGPK